MKNYKEWLISVILVCVVVFAQSYLYKQEDATLIQITILAGVIRVFIELLKLNEKIDKDE